MKYVIGFIIACIMWVVILFNVDMPQYKVYDCEMANWHPDIPADVKEECRKLRNTNRKQINEATI